MSQIAEGIIEAVHPKSRTYTVVGGLAGSERTTYHGCLWFAPSLGGLLGFNVDGVLTVGTPVKILPGNPTFVAPLAIAPTDHKAHSHRKAADGTPARDIYDDNYDPEHSYGVGGFPQTDLLEGEFAISNYLGVFAMFLTNLIKIGATENAKIECFLFDDLVRIVSGAFKHHTCLGDLHVRDEGAPSEIYHATSRRHEALGLLHANDKIGVTKAGQVESVDATHMRSRYTRFTGWLGDFVHEIVTDPATILGSLVQPRAGKSRFWNGEDGSLLWQSVSEISIEHVARVVVPHQIREHDDPEGNTVEDFALPSEFQKLWDYGPDYKDAPLCAFQLREYARWFSQGLSMARFHSLDKDWAVPSESEAEEPDFTNGDELLKAQRPVAKVVERYACMRIMRNGGLMLQSGDGWTVNSYMGDGYVSFPRNLTFESGGDMRFIAGGNAVLHARKNIELAAHKGGIKLKGRTLFDILCESGSIHIKTDAVDSETQEIPENSEFADLPPNRVHKHGVIIESASSKTVILGGTGLLLEAGGEPSEDPTSLIGHLVLRSANGDIRGKAKLDTSFEGSGKGIMQFSQEFLLKCGGDLLMRPGGNIVFKKGVLELTPDGLETNTLLVRQIYNAGSMEIRGSLSVSSVTARSVATHSGRTGKTLDNTPTFSDSTAFDPSDKVPTTVLDRLKRDSTPPIARSLPSWEFFPKSQWVQQDERIMQSPAQQYLEKDLPEEDVEKYDTWAFASNRLQITARTGAKHPDPWGTSAQQSVLQSSEPGLNRLSARSRTALWTKGTFSLRNILFKFRKP